MAGRAGLVRVRTFSKNMQPGFLRALFNRLKQTKCSKEMVSKLPPSVGYPRNTVDQDPGREADDASYLQNQVLLDMRARYAQNAHLREGHGMCRHSPAVRKAKLANLNLPLPGAVGH